MGSSEIKIESGGLMAAASLFGASVEALASIESMRAANAARANQGLDPEYGESAFAAVHMWLSTHPARSIINGTVMPADRGSASVMKHSKAAQDSRLPGLACDGNLWHVRHQTVRGEVCDVYICDGCGAEVAVAPTRESQTQPNAG